jgi:hypothetical protein
MVIAKGQQDAALGGNTLEVRVFDRVPRPIYTRPLAVPQREDTVEFAFRQ